MKDKRYAGDFVECFRMLMESLEDLLAADNEIIAVVYKGLVGAEWAWRRGSRSACRPACLRVKKGSAAVVFQKKAGAVSGD